MFYWKFCTNCETSLKSIFSKERGHHSDYCCTLLNNSAVEFLQLQKFKDICILLLHFNRKLYQKLHLIITFLYEIISKIARISLGCLTGT